MLMVNWHNQTQNVNDNSNDPVEGPPLTITVYLRLPQMKSLEPLILMVHSVLQTCTAGGLRPLWNVSTVGIQSVCIPIALHGAHSFVLAQAWHLHAYPPCLL